jgi:hypothetical protein
MSTLATLPSLPGISQSTGTDYTGLSESGVDEALNSPLTSTEINQAMGYNYSGIPATPSLTPAIPSGGQATPVASPATATAKGSVFSTVLGLIESNIENVIFVLLGLMLIGAGIFSFKGTQSVVSTATKYGSKAAEVAAA